MAVGLKSRAILPSANLGGDLSSEFPLGDAPSPDPLALSWSGVAGALANAGINGMEVGTPFSYDVRQFLTGTESATADITLELVSGDDPNTSGFTIDGDNLEYDGVAEGSGVFHLVATGVGSADDSADVSWQCAAEGSQPDSGYDWPAGAEITSSLDQLYAVATFNNIGLYWPERTGLPPTDGNEDPDENMALVRYRVFGTSEWKQGHSLWYDARTQGSGALQVPHNAEEYRGSIMELQSNTMYEIQALTPHTRKIASCVITTWNESPPEGTVTTLSSGVSTAQLTITAADSGTADGWHVYEVNSGGSTIDRNHAGDHCIRIEEGAHHIIIRGSASNYLKLRESNNAVIGIEPDVTDVIIEYVDASEMGHADTDAPNPDGGFYACNGGGLVETTSLGMTINLGIQRIVIQDSKCHDPAFDANAWAQPDRPDTPCGPGNDGNHPAGVTPIDLTNPGGNFVIRRNHFYSSSFSKMFSDGIGGAKNFSFNGNLFRDSDIYENIVTHVWDNNIEAEGANMNVRIYRNFTEYGLAMLSQGCVSLGPCYVFRNVTTRGIRDPLGSVSEGHWYKSYGKTTASNPSDGTPDMMTFGGGRVYLYHNTIYRESTATIGNGQVKNVFNGDQLGLTSVISRNNVWHTSNAIGSALQDTILTAPAVPGCSFQHDLVGSGKTAWQNVEGSTCILENPVYVSSASDIALLGKYALANGSPGRDAGVIIPGVNDGYIGIAPDMGAQESGLTPLRFGPL